MQGCSGLMRWLERNWRYLLIGVLIGAPVAWMIIISRLSIEWGLSGG